MAKVFVVDDDKDVRRLLVHTLQNAGYDTVAASNGREALERIPGEQPDVILLDVIMPIMDGLEVLGKLRGNPATRNIPVILLTALSAAKGERTAMELGVDHYVTKPWRAGTIESAVRVVLREATSQGEVVKDDSPQLIKTGCAPLDQKLGGGIPTGSLTLIEGTGSASKTVLCQYLTYGALRARHRVAYFSSETTAEVLIAKMASIGLSVSDFVLKDGLRISTMLELAESADPERLLTLLPEEMKRLPKQFDIIVVDAITDLATYSDHRAVIRMFSSCKRLCDEGRTVFIAAQSYSFEKSMVTRLRDLCDAHLNLQVEQVAGKLLRTLRVTKAHNSELTQDNVISFEVLPGTGISVSPISSIKA